MSYLFYGGGDGGGFVAKPPTLATPWTAACQAPLSTGFSRQEYWSGLPCPPPGNLPDPGIKPVSLMSLASAGGFFTTSDPWEDPDIYVCVCVLKLVSLWGSTIKTNQLCF